VERVIATTPVAAPTADLLAAVNAARNEDDLRQRLLETYAEMDRQALEGIFEKAFILAELSGRYSVLYP
jgi:phage gp29-like protein